MYNLKGHLRTCSVAYTLIFSEFFVIWKEENGKGYRNKFVPLLPKKYCAFISVNICHKSV